MTIDTSKFGVIDIDGTQLINFRDGLPGFEYCKRFALLVSEDTAPICWLQSVDDPEVALGVINSYLIMPNYTPEVSDSVAYDLNVKDMGKLLVFSVVVIPNDYRLMTANMAAPIIINTDNNMGMQAIIENDEYDVHHPIFNRLFQSAETASRA